MTQNHAIRIIDAIGEETLKDDLGWTDRALRHARSVGLFSGLWYDPLRKLCERHGVYCPVEAFSWKSPAKKYGGAVKELEADA